MAFGGIGGPRDKDKPMADINVTPLVDVMLVLLIIFMITSSMETLQHHIQKQREEKEILPQDINQKVPVSLPKTNSEPVNLKEEKKLVLSINNDLEFFLGERKILNCQEIAPQLKKKPDDEIEFGKCLDAIEQKLSSNEKLKSDEELYLRADKKIDYGKILRVMARVRKSGVTKFGLIAEPEM
jgi:biopolymer transport protein TolR